MRLPNAEDAYVPPSKLRDYLLSTSHPVGHSKARFFRACGFDETNLDALERELLTIARLGTVTEVESSSHGTKYVLEALMDTPGRGAVPVRTVWILDVGQDRPRFVTAYPA